ncbi:hypothetical protein AVEN_71649-1 [Araneus ventricosus]|uniref:Uncharacterized protein n=1 Tax=Araneus ventricosus TaxID=182803 RepID=A0A4Y2KV52_ARAVE|nr:hypothetical protein AVEN_71649-1 [Araneus ventricosus]
MLLYGASTWVLTASPRLKKPGLSTEALPPLHFRLLQRAPPTSALQTITGIMPSHLKAKDEAINISVTFMRKQIEFEGLSYQKKDYTGNNQEPFHPSFII